MKLTEYHLSNKQIKMIVQRGATALADYCVENNIHYVVVGSSGGKDSAITLGFAEEASRIVKERGFSLTPVGVIIPCESNLKAERLGRLAIETFGAREIKVDLTEIFQVAMGQINWSDRLAQVLDQDINQRIIDDILPLMPQPVISSVDQQVKKILEDTGGHQALGEWEWSKQVAQGNIKARLRMMFAVYHIARMMKGMVLSTDNLSEFWMAFWTICGDVGDFGIIQNVMKGWELIDIAIYLGVPQEIIDDIPDDGNDVAEGGDEAQLGASYPVLDYVMISLIQKGFDPDGGRGQLEHLPVIEGVDHEVVYKLAKRCINGAYKRKGTVVLSREELGLPSIEEIRL